MPRGIKEALAPIIGDAKRPELEDQIYIAVEQIEANNLQENLLMYWLREVQRKFGEPDKSLVNGRPHHMPVREAKLADPTQPIRRP